MKKLIAIIALCFVTMLSYGQTKVQLNVYGIFANYFCAKEMAMQVIQSGNDPVNLPTYRNSTYLYASKAESNLEAIKSKLSKKDFTSMQEAIGCIIKVGTEDMDISDEHKAATLLVVMEIVNNRMQAMIPKLFQLK